VAALMPLAALHQAVHGRKAMWDRLRYTWLPMLCLLAALAVAVALVAAVVVSPWLLPEQSPPRLLELFALDGTVRRTALASAAGLVVTAFVFFRPRTRSKKRSPNEPTPGSMAGA
jgi:hypothetical protein